MEGDPVLVDAEVEVVVVLGAVGASKEMLEEQKLMLLLPPPLRWYRYAPMALEENPSLKSDGR